jgi:predicted RNA polymerase sigma factor
MDEQGIEHPAFLDTYGEILYSMGRKEESEQVFRKTLRLYRERDERRRISDTIEKMQQKFGASENTYK